jgi:hypothetical protein
MLTYTLAMKEPVCMDDSEHFTVTAIEETPPAAPLPTPVEYATAVGNRIQTVFNHIGKRAPEILRPDIGNPDEAQPVIALTLTGVSPISGKRALFTVTASGMKWPLSYSFLAMALGEYRFRVSPAGDSYAMPHSEGPGAYHGYCLDDLDSGSAENFAGELVGNYFAGLEAAAYDPPSQYIMDARIAALRVN